MEGPGKVTKQIRASLLPQLSLSLMTLDNSLNQSEVGVLSEVDSSVQWVRGQPRLCLAIR